MKSVYLIRIVVIALLIFSGKAFAETPNVTDQKESVTAELIASSVTPPLPEWNSDVDFSALREAYGKRVDFSARCERNRPISEIRNLIAVQDFTSALNASLSWLKNCPVDAGIHLLAVIALEKMGKPDQAKIHKNWYVGLTDSIFKKGDGQSPSTAWVTISIGEEYEALRRLHLKKVSQALVRVPILVDKITVEDESGQRGEVYFNPQWHFIRLMHMLSK